MGVLGYAMRMTKWKPSFLIGTLLFLGFLNMMLLCMITTESVSPLPPSSLPKVTDFFGEGYKYFAYSLEQAKELVEEYPEVFNKHGIIEDATEDEIQRYEKGMMNI